MSIDAGILRRRSGAPPDAKPEKRKFLVHINRRLDSSGIWFDQLLSRIKKVDGIDAHRHQLHCSPGILSYEMTVLADEADRFVELLKQSAGLIIAGCHEIKADQIVSSVPRVVTDPLEAVMPKVTKSSAVLEFGFDPDRDVYQRLREAETQPTSRALILRKRQAGHNDPDLVVHDWYTNFCLQHPGAETTLEQRRVGHGELCYEFTAPDDVFGPACTEAAMLPDTQVFLLSHTYTGTMPVRYTSDHEQIRIQAEAAQHRRRQARAEFMASIDKLPNGQLIIQLPGLAIDVERLLTLASKGHLFLDSGKTPVEGQGYRHSVFINTPRDEHDEPRLPNHVPFSMRPRTLTAKRKKHVHSHSCGCGCKGNKKKSNTIHW